MQLALGRDNRLVQFPVDLGLKRRILFVQRGEPRGELVLIPARIELQGRLGVGLGIIDLGQHDTALGIAQRVAGMRVPEFHGCADVTRGQRVDRRPRLAVQAVQLADAFADAAVAVVQVHSGVHFAGIHPEDREVAALGIGEGFEGERHRVLARQADLAGLPRGVGGLRCGAIHGR